MILTPQIYSALQDVVNEAMGVNVCERKIIEDIHQVYVDNINKEKDDNWEEILQGNDYY